MQALAVFAPALLLGVVATGGGGAIVGAGAAVGVAADPERHCATYALSVIPLA